MIAATVTVTDISTSLYDLINTATPGQFPVPAFGGRVAEVHIQWVSGTFHLVYKTGTTDTTPGPATIVVATDSGRIFSDPATGTAVTGELTLRGASGPNVLSLKDIYLVVPDAGAGAARILAYTI